ncbi:hypothetical protein Droror1_Dr00018407 [Drosera rotundifolia]
MEQQNLLKRSRGEEEDMSSEALSKKQRSFNDLVSLLEDDEEEPNEDLSSLITSLQQELCSASHGYDNVMSNDQNTLMGNSSTSSEADSSEIIDLTTADRVAPDEEEEREKVMRHLLEASDDELGIPNIDGRVDEVAAMDGGDFYGIDDGLFWEFDDEAANYYALLQSELLL